MTLNKHKFSVSVLMSDGRGTAAHRLYVFDAVSDEEAMGMAVRQAFVDEPKLLIAGMQYQKLTN